ncbi:MAG: TSUP family transporter [Corallococcus sp.]|nr:TSUP family transporter [Bacillota bacterium]MCM1533131.1 TSUP family transporter [Corallococcus sp.]
MQIFLLILFGFLSGIIGGMGMGGGTLLVPLLSFLDLEQKTIQAINLVSFLPMCCVALGFHAKNKLIKCKNLQWIIIPAVICAVGGALCADITDNKILRWCFAAFLISVGIWQMIVAIRFIVRSKKDKNLPVLFNSALPALTENKDDVS